MFQTISILVKLLKSNNFKQKFKNSTKIYKQLDKIGSKGKLIQSKNNSFKLLVFVKHQFTQLLIHFFYDRKAMFKTYF